MVVCNLGNPTHLGFNFLYSIFQDFDHTTSNLFFVFPLFVFLSFTHPTSKLNFSLLRNLLWIFEIISKISPFLFSSFKAYYFSCLSFYCQFEVAIWEFCDFQVYSFFIFLKVSYSVRLFSFKLWLATCKSWVLILSGLH